MCGNKFAAATWAVLARALCFSSATSAQTVPSWDQVSDDEYWRTTYCVAGALPMEVRFVVEGNPAVLSGRAIDAYTLRRIIGQLDPKVSRLLEQAASAAWWQTYGGERQVLTAAVTSELEKEFVDEVASRAPDVLGIDFCGGLVQVGNAAYAELVEYFARSVRLEGGGYVQWLVDAQLESRAGLVVMLAVAMHIANIEVDLAELISTIGTK